MIGSPDLRNVSTSVIERSNLSLRMGRSTTRISNCAARPSIVDGDIRDSSPALAQDEPREVMQLHADIERVALERMIQRYEELLVQNLAELRWQRFFEDVRLAAGLAERQSPGSDDQ